MQRTLLITGSTGWLGVATLNFIEKFFANKFKIIAISSSQNQLILDSQRIINLQNFSSNFRHDKEIDILHFAYLTKDKIALMGQENYLKKTNEITQTIQEIILNNRVRSLIYISSGAVYKPDNLYSTQKIKDENLFKNLANSQNFNLLIPRLFNIGGAYIKNFSDYAISNFIIQAIENSQININSSNLVYRSYIEIFDFCKILCHWLLDENPSKIFEFDTAGLEIIEVEDLAKIISCKINNAKITRKNIDKSASPDNYFAHNNQQKLLLDKYNINLQDITKICDNTINYIKNIRL